MSREIAKEILYDNMSDNTAKHIKDISFLEGWIIDAMIEYHEKQVKNNDLLHSVSNCGEKDASIHVKVVLDADGTEGEILTKCSAKQFEMIDKILSCC